MKAAIKILKKITAFTFISCLVSAPLNAEVIRADNNNFDLSFETAVKASVSKLASTFENISTWWHPSHTYSGDSEKLVLDSKAHCFCETLNNGGFVRHLDWVFYRPKVEARFVGGLGPLQTLPVDGVLTFKFVELSESTATLKVTYHVSGSGNRLKGWASAVNQVLGEQVSRLKQEAEK